MAETKYEHLFHNIIKPTYNLLVCLVISAILFFPATDIRAQERSPDEIIELKAVAGLQYDKVRFIVRPGTTLELVLENASEMMHNLLIVNPGTREQVVAEAEAMGEQGLENDFIPGDSNVLAAVPLLSPGEIASIIFQVPSKEGAYPYVCTYPAHGLVMYGVMHVTNNPDLLPPVEEDPDVPEVRRRGLWMPADSFHPYPMEMPQITRLFMPEASPAAIAVGMEGNQSYCWDAGVCHLRYSWSGGYIDPSKQWDAKSTEFAKITGEIFYKNRVGFPFRIVNRDSIPEPAFQGYELVEDYPRFIYKMGDVAVRELIMPAGNGKGLEITYHLESVSDTIWYATNGEEGIRVNASKGEWEGNILRLSPEQAEEFTISITPE